MRDFMLVFELTPEGDQLEIHADEAGLAVLQRQLGFLVRGSSHVHLKTPSWAGDELTEVAQGKDHRILNHVKIYSRRDKAAT
jgi:hypothetical protein